MIVSIQILEHFINIDKLSSFRFLSYIKAKFNNHLHRSEFDQICKDLTISKTTILKNLKQLELLGICKSYGNYIRFFSWKRWCSGKSKIVNIKLENLRSLKYLRSLYYNLKYKSSWRLARKNAKNSELNKKQKSSGFYSVSASFVQKVTGIQTSLQTLLRHLNRGSVMNMNEVKKYKHIHFSGTLDNCKFYRKYLEVPSTIMKLNKQFILFTYLPNICRFFI